MKIKEMRELNVEDLQGQIADTRKQLFENRLKHNPKQNLILDNPAEFRQLRHRIAQLETVLNEKGRK